MKRHNLWLAGLLVAALTIMAGATPALAQRPIHSEIVHFKKGATTARIEGRIKGYQVMDYVLAAKSGQYMNISMATKNLAAYFNILAPGERDVAMFIGSIRGNQYEGVAPASGTYTVRVYMMRSAARRKETARYQLEMIIGTDHDLPPAPPKKPQ